MLFCKFLGLKFKKIEIDQRGTLVLYAVVFGVIAFSVVVSAISAYAIGENRASVYKHNSELAFQVAEAGINYYKWHLAHNQTDYQDGTATSGPYLHDYKDKDGNVIGHFSLDITPPLTGSSVVTIESTGWLDAQPQSRKTIKVRMGFPSLTDYSMLTEAEIWIGEMETVSGKFHSNHGIRFDGLGNAPITSAVATFICRSGMGCSRDRTKDGIFGVGGPKEFWEFPVPEKDFDVISLTLNNIKQGAANGGGIYLSSSGYYGWRLRFLSNGKVEANKVTAVNCYSGYDIGSSWPETFCIDIKTLGGTTFTYNIPTSSYIYVEDNVWVEGIVKGRAVVGTRTGSSIMLTSSTIYAAKDGTNSLGLVAEHDILASRNSKNYLEVDAVLVAQNGAAKRYYYSGNIKESIIIYGAIITSGQWTWTWVDGSDNVVSGYRSTTMIYDENLTYGPPAGFPVGTDYQIISWEIVK